MQTPEENVSEFYSSVGWETQGSITEDARRWEDLRDAAKEYVSNCRLRVLKHIPKSGEYILDMASGPIQFPEYLEYSKNFKKRYCVDLSSSALESAKQKIGEHGVFLHGSFFNIPLEENFFDCSISLHTIYHIDENQQEEAVRKLIAVTKIGKRVLIVYSNPNSIFKPINWLITKIPRIPGIMASFFGKSETKSKDGKNRVPSETIDPALYFQPHRLEWWYRFGDVADIQILPWRSLRAKVSRKLIPNNKLGKLMFRTLFYLEDKFPNFFSRHFDYPMIILTKKVA
jgi:ubiquinone/menaquinone biosynthesis C-methylase UbiE